MSIATLVPSEVLPVDVLSRLDMPGPRYTSYPTADRLHEGFTAEHYRQALRERTTGGRLGMVTPLSVYVHIPFCESVCYYCACNKVVTRHRDRAASYLDALELEMALHAAEWGSPQAASQLHLGGGGTPTFLSDAELERLMQAARRHFRFDPQAEMAIEVDPRTASAKRLIALARLGFNRISTQPECDLVGLGVSAIGRMGVSYAQNAKTLQDYLQSVSEGRFATARGLRAGRDDLVRGAVIMALMCQGRVDFEAIELAHLVTFEEYFAAELQALVPFAEQGLVELDGDSIQLTATGWFAVRGVAMVFDRYLQSDHDRSRFSRIV